MPEPSKTLPAPYHPGQWVEVDTPRGRRTGQVLTAVGGQYRVACIGENYDGWTVDVTPRHMSPTGAMPTPEPHTRRAHRDVLLAVREAEDRPPAKFAPPPHRPGCTASSRAMSGLASGCPGCQPAIDLRAAAEAKTMRALQRTGGNATVHTDACHARVARQWNGDYRNLHRSPTPGCQGCDTGRKGRRK